MHALVTGATGLIGNRVAHLLVERGHQVRALVRDPQAARPKLTAAIELVQGDVTAPASLPAALAGIDHVFHAAGMPEQWQADDSIFDRVNHQGTIHVLEAALAAGVRRVVYTSTMDVFAAPPGGTLVETRLDDQPKPTAYERSKQAADRAVADFHRRGLDVVHINPSAVYGPSPVHVSLNSFFIKLLNGQMPALPPGGMSVVYVDDVAEAHLAAAERGRSGERYLVSGEYASLPELVQATYAALGQRRQPPPVVPLGVMKALAAVSAPLARTFRFEPLVAPGQLAFLQWQARIDASKAKQELGFQPRSLADGLPRTLAALKEQGLIRA